MNPSPCMGRKKREPIAKGRTGSGASFCYGGMVAGMVERAERSEKYEEIAGEVMQEHEELRWIRTAGIRIGFMESDRRRTSHGGEILGECIRVRDLYKCFIPYDFLIVVYGQNVHGMSREQLKILIHHELLHVGMYEKNGQAKYVTIPHDVEDFREILDRYGLDWARH